MSKSIEQEKEDLHTKTFHLMLKILVIFGVPAIIGFFVGRYIDTRFDIRPNGSLMVLGVTFITSWLITIRMYKNISAELKAFEKKEEAHIAAKQKEIKDSLSINKE